LHKILFIPADNPRAIIDHRDFNWVIFTTLSAGSVFNINYCKSDAGILLHIYLAVTLAVTLVMVKNGVK
jgi:hypothetical protein